MKNLQDIFDCISDQKISSAQVEVHYIPNRDGSIRWVWSITSTHPHFLKFYYIKEWMTQLFALMIKLVFALNLQKWVFKKAKVNIQQDSILNTQNWALFTGTTGPNRKFILYQIDNNLEGKFSKIALSSKSKELIINEIENINLLCKSKELSFNYPTLLNADEQLISFKENKNFSIRINQWTDNHSLFIKSIQNITPKTFSFEEYDKDLSLGSRIKSLSENRKKLPSGIIKKLNYLHHSLNGATVKTHFSHGDFTPWNSYSNTFGDLYVYDWELSRSSYPEGFDFFHFNIQNGILTQNKNWKSIKIELKNHYDKLFTANSFDHNLSLYLLVNVLNYLEIYEKQEHWHTQIHWLLETWNLAISDILESRMNDRQLILLDVFDQLHDADYLGLKLNDQAEKISEYSDVDLILLKSTSKKLIQFLRNHPLASKMNIQSGSAVTKFYIVTKNNTLLSIDAIHQLKRKSLEYLSVPEMLKNPYIDHNGIKNTNLQDTLLFLGLFYGLNNTPIPNKFLTRRQTISSGNKNLDCILNEQFNSGIPNQISLMKEVCKLPANKGFSAIRNVLNYYFDTLKSFFQQKGMVITFSGVDGAGKSTIIENTKIEIEKKFRKRVVILRHRPSILPILSAWTKGKINAEKSATEALPRQGQNKSFLSSLFRFGYYYSDYLLGQFYIYLRYVLKGEIVLYDRYYFDFINDSLRSNITLPKWLLRSAYTFLLKPNLNFFLYADSKTILSRKKELDEKTINSLTSDYKLLFQNLEKGSNGKYLAIENININTTISTISNCIQAELI